jgi:two-component system cell cycle response regulator
MPARILIIEDNPINAELMAYLLRAFGHTILSAGDGEEGLQMAWRERPDLILCDVGLPKMDGCELTRLLKANAALATIPVVAVTASAMAEQRQKILSAGFDGFLIKPFEVENFVAQVEQFLASAKAANHGTPAPAL